MGILSHLLCSQFRHLGMYYMAADHRVGRAREYHRGFTLVIKTQCARLIITPHRVPLVALGYLYKHLRVASTLILITVLMSRTSYDRSVLCFDFELSADLST